MAEGEEPKKEWDETPPWIEKLLRLMPKPQAPAITFVIQRDELLAHLQERATHFITEATLYRSGEKPIPSMPDLDYDGLPIDPRMAKPTPEMIEASKREQLEWICETLTNRAKTFRFMASHLAKTDAFVIEMQTAQWLDLVPAESYRAIAPRYVPRAVVGNPGTIPTGPIGM